MKFSFSSCFAFSFEEAVGGRHLFFSFFLSLYLDPDSLFNHFEYNPGQSSEFGVFIKNM